MNFKNILAILSFLIVIPAFSMDKDRIIEQINIIKDILNDLRAFLNRLNELERPDRNVRISIERLNSSIEEQENNIIKLEIKAGTNELYNAIKDENLESVKNIIDNGSKILSDHLEIAIKTKNIPITEFLLKHIDKYKYLEPYLLYAIKNNDISSIEFLLQQGLDPNIFGEVIQTQFFKGSLELYKILEKYLTGVNDKILLRSIIRTKNNIDLFHEWLKKNQLSNLNNNDLVYLYASSPHVAEILLNQGYDIDMINDRGGNTPLIQAATDPNLETILFLVKNGSDLYIKNKQGLNALRAAKQKLINREKELRENPRLQSTPIADTTQLKKIIEFLECKNPAFSACEVQKELKRKTAGRIMETTGFIPEIANLVSGYLYDQPEEKELSEKK